MQWLWFIVIVANPLLSSDFSLFLPKQNVQSMPAPVANSPSPVTVALVLVLTVLIFALTFYILWKLPKKVGTEGARATKRAATVIIPVITHHKPISKKRRERLSYRVVLCIKLIIISAPLIGLVFAQPIKGLDSRAIWVVGLFCATFSFIYVGAQQLLAGALGVKTNDLW